MKRIEQTRDSTGSLAAQKHDRQTPNFGVMHGVL